MKKITIGLFIDTYFPMVDGVVNVVDNYARRLKDYANVIVFAPACTKDFDDSTLPYKVVRCKSIKVPTIDYSLPLPNFDKEFRKKIDESNLDIVHIHSPFSIGNAGIKYSKKRKIPCIGTMHSQYKQDFKKAFKFEFIANLLTSKLIVDTFNKCDECWAVNQKVAKIFHEEYGYKMLPKVMNNATDMKPILKEEADKYIEDKFNIEPDTLVFLFVGRINKLKNIFFTIDALEILKEKMNFKMIFVGNGQDEEELKKYVEFKNMQDYVILAGRVTDRKELSCYYKRAYLFLFPSLYDASSLVQIEAASQKTPTIFLEGAATCANVIDKQNGFISKNDIQSYAKYIEDVVKDTTLYDKVANNAYKELYVSWDDKVKEAHEEYLSLLDLLIEESNKKGGEQNE